MKEIRITDEQYKFLKELSNELKTQDNLATRKPVVWRIRDLVKRQVSDDYGVWDNYNYKINSKTYTWKTADNVENVMDVYDELKEDLYIEESKEYWDKLYYLFSNFCGSIEEWEEFAETIKLASESNITCTYEVEEYEFIPHHYFLTKRAAKEHIEKYSYHFKRPQLYCDCSSETPELEQLLEIIESIQ